MRFSLAFAALAISTVAFGQDYPFQIGYAANLNVGDSVVNLTNDGFRAGPFNNAPATQGNICANVYVFDPQEEEIGCCACLVTPNGLNSLSVASDLISNNLTPAVPTSVVIKLLASVPAMVSGQFTGCNPATAASVAGDVGTGNYFNNPLAVTRGLMAWGTTLEPSATPGTYNAVHVSFLEAALVSPPLAAQPGSEEAAITSLCNFIQTNGTGYGICKSCRLGALAGAKQ